MTQAPGNQPRVIHFRGWISCRRDGEGPLGLIIAGRALQNHHDEGVQLAFSCRAPVDMPEALEDAYVEFLGDNRYRVTSGDRSWTLQGPVHVHREVAAAFYKALPPRPVPWQKRVFWRLMLALAANSFTRKLLLRGPKST
jgi:hypothetical protein